jgi:hypothetical protein
VPSDAGVDLRSARLAQGFVALALGAWFAFHLDPVVPAVAALCAAGALLGARGPLLLVAGLVPTRRPVADRPRGPVLPERLTLGLEAMLLGTASALLWGPANRVGDLLALVAGLVAAVDATSALSPGRWLAARVAGRRAT